MQTVVLLQQKSWRLNYLLMLILQNNIQMCNMFVYQTYDFFFYFKTRKLTRWHNCLLPWHPFVSVRPKLALCNFSLSAQLIRSTNGHKPIWASPTHLRLTALYTLVSDLILVLQMHVCPHTITVKRTTAIYVTKTECRGAEVCCDLKNAVNRDKVVICKALIWQVYRSSDHLTELTDANNTTAQLTSSTSTRMTSSSSSSSATSSASSPMLTLSACW